MNCRRDGHQRQSIGVPGYDYSQNGACFITVRGLFSLEAVLRALLQSSRGKTTDWIGRCGRSARSVRRRGRRNPTRCPCPCRCDDE